MIKRVKKAYPRKGFLAAQSGSDPSGGEKCNISPRDGVAKNSKSADSESPLRGISSADYEMFFKFLQNINDVDLALTFFKYGQGIDKSTLKHAANTVAHVQLRDHLIDVIFTLFDEDRKPISSFEGFFTNFKIKGMLVNCNIMRINFWGTFN